MLSVKDHSWRVFAECTNIHVDVFFPVDGGSVGRAKNVCRDCPVRRQCLQDALDRDELYGIWGGLTTTERMRLKHGQPVKTRPQTLYSEVPRTTPSGHGYTRYRRGCRCGVCREGNASMQRAYQTQRRIGRTCQVCAAPISGRGKHRYCSTECRQTSQRKRMSNG